MEAERTVAEAAGEVAELDDAIWMGPRLPPFCAATRGDIGTAKPPLAPLPGATVLPEGFLMEGGTAAAA
jgi:hypothetical protein